MVVKLEEVITTEIINGSMFKGMFNAILAEKLLRQDGYKVSISRNVVLFTIEGIDVDVELNFYPNSVVIKCEPFRLRREFTFDGERELELLYTEMHHKLQSMLDFEDPGQILVNLVAGYLESWGHDNVNITLTATEVGALYTITQHGEYVGNVYLKGHKAKQIANKIKCILE